MLMVFNSGALLRWVSELHPRIYKYFARIYNAVGTSAEADTIAATYWKISAVNFSKELLEPLVKKHPGRVTVLPVTNLTWSDWGTESRIVSSLKKHSGKVTWGKQPISAVQKSSGITVKRRDPVIRLHLQRDKQQRPDDGR